ncbi:MAG: polysaccharide deacetylase [Flaviaesturariibacter sp.]|nr:polysaccharide deacetylase [Flaviaesturariibacter sp.]
MNQNVFVISLDFELLWGVRDKRTRESYGANLLGVRQVIPRLLELFDRYGVNATFATVGFLFAKNKEELLEFVPTDLPRYSADRYSPYANGYMDTVGANEEEDPYHYGSSLIDRILEHPGHEVATHTFSHFYCLEGASIASFEADLAAAQKIAGRKGVELKSIVFPRNQYSQAHIDSCRKAGIIAFRANEQSAVYTPRNNEDQSKVIRAARFLDTYANLTGHHSFVPVETDGIVNIPASRFLRPHTERFSPFDGRKLARIRGSMLHAAKRKQGFHLWWHPHNFGIHIDENIRFLEEILQFYRHLHQEFGMQSKTMRTIAEETLAHGV